MVYLGTHRSTIAVARSARTVYRFAMDMTFGLYAQVRRLNRQGMTVAGIARALGMTDQGVWEVHNAFALPLAGETIDSTPHPCEKDRADMVDKLPKRMQDRMRRIAAERRRDKE